LEIIVAEAILAAAPTASEFYVYLHRRATTGEIFYVGKGSNKRAWTAQGRNRHWQNIAAKEKLSRSVAKAWTDPSVKERMSVAIRAAKSTPQSKARQAELNREAWSRGERRARMAAMSKAMWADPRKKEEIRQSLKDAQTAGVRLKKSASRKAFLASPESRRKCTVSGKKWSGEIRNIGAGCFQRSNPQMRLRRAEPGDRRRWYAERSIRASRRKVSASMKSAWNKVDGPMRQKIQKPVRSIENGRAFDLQLGGLCFVCSRNSE
jgi:hypothetical protein